MKIHPHRQWHKTKRGRENGQVHMIFVSTGVVKKVNVIWNKVVQSVTYIWPYIYVYLYSTVHTNIKHRCFVLRCVATIMENKHAAGWAVNQLYSLRAVNHKKPCNGTQANINWTVQLTALNMMTQKNTVIIHTLMYRVTSKSSFLLKIKIFGPNPSMYLNLHCCIFDVTQRTCSMLAATVHLFTTEQAISTKLSAASIHSRCKSIYMTKLHIKALS